MVPPFLTTLVLFLAGAQLVSAARNLAKTRRTPSLAEKHMVTSPAGAELCPAGWDLVEEGDVCSCDGPASEFAQEECPPGMHLEGADCVRFHNIHIPAVPPKETKAECMGGRREICGNKVTCFTACDCQAPSTDRPDSTVVVGQCECAHGLSCAEPATMVIRNDEPFCVTAGRPSSDRIERNVTSPKPTWHRTCTNGAKLVGLVCRLVLSQCPEYVEVKLDQKAIGCGPNSDTYIAHMLAQLRDTAIIMKTKGISSRNYQSCSASCTAVYTKFSECAFQNDAEQCVGRAGRSGKAIRAIGHLSEEDTCRSETAKSYNKVQWLQQTSACSGTPRWLKAVGKTGGLSNFLPCKDMYGSEHNFENRWTEAVANIKNIAKRLYIKLHGEFVNKPFGRLSCRRAYCEKVETFSSQTEDHRRALGSCLAVCEEKYG